MTEHTKGPWKAVQGDEFDETRWLVVVDGDQEFLVASIENGQPGDTLETAIATARGEGKS